MGGARSRWPATLAGRLLVNIECQQSRIDFRLRTRYVDEQATSRWMTPWRASKIHRRRGGPSLSRCAATPRRSYRSW